MRSVGSIYSRDKSANSKSHVSSTDKSMEDMFPVSKYLMGSTVKSAPSPCALSQNYELQASRALQSPRKVTFSRHKEIRTYTECSKDSLDVQEQDLYCEVMSSIRIGNVSNLDSLDQLNRTYSSPVSYPSTPSGWNNIPSKSDSLQKYQRSQPLSDLTNKPQQQSADNRTIRQLMCLQNLFREVVNLKEFEQLKGKAERVEDMLLSIEQQILSRSHQKSSEGTCSVWTRNS